MTDLLADRPGVIQIPVTGGAMDVFRHDDKTLCFRWVENARIAAPEAWPG